MKKKGHKATLSFRFARWRAGLAVCLALSLTVASGGCFSGDEGETFYGRVSMPARQEFRWSDGGLPQVFDPALAAAPPDTDVVRAMFEGLTEYDARTLTPVSGVATRWESAADDREWTFHLRHEARWSNGEPVTAHDFVRSWQRTLSLGERAPHARLLANLEGAQVNTTPRPTPAPSPIAARRDESAANEASPVATPEASPTPAKAELGVEALNDFTLRVRLQRPDKNFPSLVAHPVFRPVHQSKGEKDVERGETNGTGGEANAGDAARRETNAPVISNGAFNLSAQADDGVVLERADSYWNAKIVALERVRFVAATDAEAALSAYRAGEVDAVTNANIEPLAVKLLAPYKDFRRATFGALTYYDFNTARAPFNDRRVRQALSLAVDRQRLSVDTLGGATEAAVKFLPSMEQADEAAGDAKDRGAAFDADAARRLLAEAGFGGGNNFPRIRLLVNRNEQHRAVAAAVAGMWRNVLGVETEIVLLNWDEYEAALRGGVYDVARRSMVMQTVDEESNMLAMFDPERLNFATPPETNGGDGAEASASPAPRADTRGDAAAVDAPPNSSPPKSASQTISSEQQALEELPAIPLYFASSYALVKPYVAGFDANLLDAPSLQHVRINTNWQPPKRDSSIRIVSNRLTGR
ncbi:MAG: oligopeptide transport system substrate-binding protein [Pyrinomonadaceae bacterium]|jgi:ABC-type oligopeptide transport system substrate-binding subunit|nr:oligopeptide transport system substrate-binding protein [Pyrinomonadaceae bacterium]